MILRSVHRVHNAVVDTMAAIAAASLFLMALLVAAHVLMRATVGAGVRGVNEVSQYLLVAVVYAGLAAALRDGSFIRVHLLISRMSGRLQSMFIRLVALISLGFMGLLTWRSWSFALESFRRGTESIGVLETPLWMPHSIVAIGSTALTVQLLAILADPTSQRTTEGTSSDGVSATMDPDKWHDA